MSSSAVAPAAPPVPESRPAGLLRPGAYCFIIAAVVLLAGAASLRNDGILACRPPVAGTDSYVGYCGGSSYGDYDHGAFWFGLEPEATGAAKKADLLVIGNSRTQMGFSARATEEWFSGLGARFYLLGFSHNENYHFEGPLLRRLQLHPRAYVINLDLFFESATSGPAHQVMTDPSARTRYLQKRLWQHLQRWPCGALPAGCRHEPGFYRSRQTGAWTQQGGDYESKPVGYNETVDTATVRSYVEAARAFIPQLGLPPECVLLTVVPSARTPSATARAITAELGMDLFAPEPEGLVTYDGSHLDRPSAERWSGAFLEAAEARIRQCVGRPAVSQRP